MRNGYHSASLSVLDSRTHSHASGGRGVGVAPLAVDPFALSLNENPYPPLPSVQAALIESIAAANRYPEFLPQRLRDMIAGRIGVRGDQVVLGAGATGVALQILHALTDPGDRIALTSPTFDGYPIMASMTGLVPVTASLTPQGHHNLDALADAASDAAVVVLCRPHNPTGTLEPVREIERFMGRVPTDTVVVLDEAYVEFVAPEYRLDAPALIQRFPNVVVLRTFSKAYGLAGLRIGYAFGSPELAAKLWKLQLPFGIGITGIIAVAACYEAEAQLRHRIRLITLERRSLRRQLHSMGVYSTDSHANFVYLPATGGRPWREVFDTTGLQVRHYDDGGVRVTVGVRASTRAILAAVQAGL